MKIRRVIRKHVEHNKDGIQAAADINAVISVNVSETTAKADRGKAKEAAERKPPR